MATKTARAPRRKKKAVRAAASDASGEASGAKRRGRKANVWIEGLSPQTFKDYRKKHGISEAKLADYLGTTLTSYRNWVADKNRPSAENQERYKELLSKDYVAPPEGEKKARGRRKKGEAAPGMTMSVAVARDAAANGAGAHGTDSSNAVAAVVLEYVRRLPAGQALSIEDLEGHIARIKRALG